MVEPIWLTKIQFVIINFDEILHSGICDITSYKLVFIIQKFKQQI